MNTKLVLGLTMAVLLAAVMALPSHADEQTTITGMGMCAHCMLQQGKECQTVIQVQDGDKTVTYHLVDNDVAKKIHGKVCTSKKKVTATGTVKKVDGKMELTASSIELVKE